MFRCSVTAVMFAHNWGKLYVLGQTDTMFLLRPSFDISSALKHTL